MTEIPAGTTVRLLPGTRVGVRDPELYNSSEPWKNWEWHVVEDDDVEMLISYVGCSHSTMNGGGRDYSGTCPMTGYHMSVRTTFVSPEAKTFAVAS